MNPRVGVDPFVADGVPGAWTVRWRLTNLGTRSIRLLTAIQPHTQFHTRETPVPRDVPAGETIEISLPVRFAEAPGTVVENPFLIVRLADDGHEWRALARVRITAGPDGQPVAGPLVVITTQRVGGIPSSS